MMPSNLGIQVEEERGPDQSIARLSTARTAFVGRTLRGPVNRPIFIRNFTEFQHVFGGLWQPSPLGYAVEQFFDNGGREALVVRVVNGARSATLSLSAGSTVLQLRAVRPGTREFLRASVDYDNIPEEETTEFNLTVQRVRALGTAHVEDQEIFRRLSVRPTAEDYWVNVIAASELVRLAGEPPAERPDATLDAASGLAIGYVTSNPDGDDGAPLTDYDLIGSEIDRTGLFALGQADYFNFLCIPPLSREQDVGPSTLLVGARYCKERRALLIVDPPSGWHTADDALEGMRGWNFSNENALMYFPRVLAYDKLRGHFESFAPSGAVAGMLARGDESSPVWAAAKHEDAVLRPGYRPTCLVTEDRRAKLASLGVNTLQAVRSAARSGLKARTLGAGAAANADWQLLPARRLALFILNSIERGTRWVVLAQPHIEVAEAALSQVREFFEALHEAGAFGTRRMEESFFVAVDHRGENADGGEGAYRDEGGHRVRRADRGEGGHRGEGADQGNPDGVAAAPVPTEFQLVVGFAAARAREFHSFRITQSTSGSQVQPVSLNRLNFAQYSPAELEWVDNLASQLQP